MKLVPQNPGPLAIWLQATRPQTLPAALCPVLIGAAMAYRATGEQHYLDTITNVYQFLKDTQI